MFWRLGVDLPDGRGLDVRSEPNPSPDRQLPPDAVEQVWPGSKLDALVFGEWLHAEWVAPYVYWVDVAGVRLVVRVDTDGRPVRVVTELDARDGVEYAGDVTREVAGA